MAASYEVWLCSDVGERLVLLDAWERLEYVKALGKVGAFSLSLGQELPADLLQVDRQIQVWRRPVGGVLSLDFLGFLRYWKHELKGGSYTLTLAGPDHQDILARRIVAYPAGHAFAVISGGAADNGIKDIFDENFLATATDSDRELQAYGLSVAADEGAAAGVTMGYAWRDVVRVLADISQAAQTAGGEVFYGLEITGIDAATGLVSMEFRTAVGQWGEDRTWDTATPVVFGPEYGNVESAWLEVDHREEVTYVYAGGQGEGANRVIETASDADRIARSVWNRREAFRDARNESDPDAVQAAADEALAAGRPIERFGVVVLDTEQARYGRDWALGDLVTAQAFGRQFDALVRSVQVSVNRNGQETISARLSNEEAA